MIACTNKFNEVVNCKDISVGIIRSEKPVEYRSAMKRMREFVTDICDDKLGVDCVLWFLEHENVYTGGRNFDNADVLRHDVEFVEADRGGKVTYHGPGQRIVYFIIPMKLLYRAPNIRDFVNRIKRCVQRVLQSFNVESYTDESNPGIWVSNNGKKIASIGLRVSGGIIHHGFAINVNCDLSYFDGIVPCGMRGMSMTSVEVESSCYETELNMQNFDIILKESIFKEIFHA